MPAARRLALALRLILVAWLALLPLVALAPAQAQLPGAGTNAGTNAARGNNIAASLVAETPTPRPGQTVTLAFVMQPRAGWHGYWENPGDAGIGMTLEWDLPAGVKAGALRYPVPETLLISGIMNYVYEGPYAPLVTLTIPKSARPGTRLPIRVKADWLACTREICVPEQATLGTSLTIGNGAVAPAIRTRFDGYRARLAPPLGSQAVFASDGKRFRLSVPFPAGAKLSAPYFFARTDGVVDYGAPQKAWRDGDRLVIETAARGTGPDRIAGVLRIGPHMGLDLVARRGPVKRGGVPMAMAGDTGSGDDPAGPGGGTLTLLLAALGGAILGGLLLNIMPCVFPILSLKAISLAKAGGDERAVRRDAIAYTLGIVLVCIGLGAALLVLRALGEQVGWAFQLQDPRIILVLLVLVTGIAFNLAGLFEFGTIAVGDGLARQDGAKGAFWTGALAAFVATPCTAPFMASAMGTALVLPPAAALLVFAGLGLGLALPFLLIGFVPALRRRMPRPGAWMETFRRIMAVPMFLTALALVWLLGQQTGTDGLVLGLAAALATGLLLWWYGLGQRSRGRGGWLPLGGALAAAIAAVVALPADSAADAGPGPAATAAARTLPSEAFSEARLAALRAEGRPVFAYFTADWCLTCKANEAAAIQRADTAKAFAKANVAVLEGDWTRRDAAISRYLEAHGRSGVPLYVYYAPGQEGRILPQVLSVETLTELVS